MKFVVVMNNNGAVDDGGGADDDDDDDEPFAYFSGICNKMITLSTVIDFALQGFSNFLTFPSLFYCSAHCYH